MYIRYKFAVIIACVSRSLKFRKSLIQGYVDEIGNPRPIYLCLNSFQPANIDNPYQEPTGPRHFSADSLTKVFTIRV